jgi:Rrf2 family protein
MMNAMKLPVSTEWVLHCATTLAQLEPEEAATAGQLARYYDVPSAHLAKQLQALVRAGVLAATTGPRGGFRLARPASEISLLDVVEAIAGTSSPYECREIRQQGTGALPEKECREACILASIMDAAHEAWRRHLDGFSLADVIETLPQLATARTRRRLSSTPRSPATEPPRAVRVPRQPRPPTR